MLTRRWTASAALASFLAFCVSLTLDLHGAVAVALALSLFFFLSASIGRERPKARGVKRAVGGVLVLASGFSIVENPRQNVVFVTTVAVIGIVLAVDEVALWVTRKGSRITSA